MKKSWVRLLISLIKKLLASFVRFNVRLEGHRQRRLDYLMWGLETNENGYLMVGGCNSAELAREYGTPLHVVDRNRLIANYYSFNESFKAFTTNVEVFYSYKTNTIPGVLRVLHQQGAGAEVVSPYELWLALTLGVTPDRIIYNGICKPDEALRTAIAKEIKLINIDSFGEIQRIEKISEELGKSPRVGLRVHTGVGGTDQFGFRIESGEAFQGFKQCARAKHLKVCGMHTHLGSGLKDVYKYVAAIKIMLRLAKDIKEKLGIDIEYFDLGGGFGVPTVRSFGTLEYMFYWTLGRFPKAPKAEDCPPISRFAKHIVDHLNEGCTMYNLKNPILHLEPGRAITSNAQILLIEVGEIKHKHDKIKTVIVNGSRNIAYPVIWEYHEVFLANKMSERNEEIYRIAGPACYKEDLLYSYKKLPRLEEGDILAVMDAGAYFILFSQDFNIPQPPVVIVSNGKHGLIRQRESYQYMVELNDF